MLPRIIGYFEESGDSYLGPSSWTASQETDVQAIQEFILSRPDLQENLWSVLLYGGFVFSDNRLIPLYLEDYEEIKLLLENM